MAENRGKDNQSVKTILLLLLVLIVILLAWNFLRRVKPSDKAQTSVGQAFDSTKHYELKYLIPTGDADDEVVYHTAYILGYDNATEQPAWVLYELTDEHTHGEEERSNNFRSDPHVSAVSADPKDYLKSGYDKGHLVPAGDMKYDNTLMSETFFMSNMCPQKPTFNRGIWKHLESQVRNWAEANHDIYISAGPIFFNPEPATIGHDRVAVPDAFYKVIIDITSPEYKGIAFIMKNEGSSQPLQNFAVSIDSVQNLTGINFFPGLPDDLEQAVESTYDLKQWFSNDTYHP